MQRYYSNIYWHLTGSPKDVDWSKAKKPKDILKQGAPRSASESFDILKLILSSRTLKGTCVEFITDSINTDKFCCVTDIPLKDLPTHSQYYGRSAIGFKSEAIHKSFLPVMYIPSLRLPTTTVVRQKTLDERMEVLKSEAGLGPMSIEEEDRFRFRSRHFLRRPDFNKSIQSIALDKDRIQSSLFKNQIKITDFSDNDSESYYREREWRCIGDFCFEFGDIEAVIVESGLVDSAKEFISEYGVSCPVFSWDFIEKS